MNQDFVEMLSALSEADAEFLVVGAHALAVHGTPRATGDLDLWVKPTEQNAQRVWSALVRFGAPLTGLSIADLSERDVVFQMGLPPRRIDLLTSISGVEFEAAWSRRVVVDLGTMLVPVLGKSDLVANKRAAGRPQDLVDIEALGSP